jgi:hypothetical protein
MLHLCAKKGKVVQVLIAEMVQAVNSTGTIKISTRSMKRVILVLSIESPLIVTRIIIKQWLIMTYPMTGRDIPSKAMQLVAYNNSIGPEIVARMLVKGEFYLNQGWKENERNW